MNPNSLVKFIVITPALQKRKLRRKVVSSKSRVTVAKKGLESASETQRCSQSKVRQACDFESTVGSWMAVTRNR